MDKRKLITVLFPMLASVIGAAPGEVITENLDADPAPRATVEGDLIVVDDGSQLGGNLEVEGYSNLVGDLMVQGMDIKTLYARGGALGSTHIHRRVIYDGRLRTATRFSGTSFKGLALLVIDRMTGDVESHISYDVHGSGNIDTPTAARTEMALQLSLLDESQIVVITSQDAWRMNEGLREEMLRCGASPEAMNFDRTNSHNRRCYALVGIPGIGAGNGLEFFNEEFQGDLLAEILTFLIRPEPGSRYTPVGLSNSGTDHNSGDAVFYNKVGIGTQAPEADLHVAGDLQVDGAITSSNTGLNLNGEILFGTEAPIDGGIISIVDAGGGLDDVRLLSFSENRDPANVDEFLFKGHFAGSGSHTNSIAIGSGLSVSDGWEPNIMTWQGDGKVGIGTSSPDVSLHVEANSKNGAREVLFKGTVDDSLNSLIIANATGHNGKMIPMIASNVYGDPRASLSILGTGPSSSDVYDVNNVGVTIAARIHDGNVLNGTFSPYADRDIFQINNHSDTLMRIKANGRMGIGTTTPSAKLHVAGDAQVDSNLTVNGTLTLVAPTGDIPMGDFN